MKSKKVVAILATGAIVAGGVYFANHVRQAQSVHSQAEMPRGIVNPDRAAEGLKTQAQPQLSTERFTPPPTITTGKYIDPDYHKESKQQDASKKNH